MVTCEAPRKLCFLLYWIPQFSRVPGIYLGRGKVTLGKEIFHLFPKVVEYRTIKLFKAPNGGSVRSKPQL